MMPQTQPEAPGEDIEEAADSLLAQHRRMVELRRSFAEVARRNAQLYRKILEEQELMKKELLRIKMRLKQLSTARS